MNKRNKRPRQGTSATEVIVAATLLLSMIGLVVPTTIRAGRVLRDARHYQTAMNELSNQFEYLSGLNQVDRDAALKQLQVSEPARQSLADASLHANLATLPDGVRLTLSLSWDRGLNSQPVQLVGWLSSSVNESTNSPSDGEQKKGGLR